MKIPFNLNILRSKIITVPPPVKWWLYFLSFPLPLRHPPPSPSPGVFRSLKSLRKCRGKYIGTEGGGLYLSISYYAIYLYI